MYSLKDAYPLLHGEQPAEGWDGCFDCMTGDKQALLRLTQDQTMISCYIFGLITRGKMEFMAGTSRVSIQANDLYVYMPGMDFRLIEISDDFQVYSVLAEESMTLDTSAAYNLVRLAYLPVVKLHQPKMTLTADAAERLVGRITDIMKCMHSDHLYKREVVRMLYNIFLLDLHDIQEHASVAEQSSHRVEELFMAFIQLLPRHFTDHHDVAFYASRLSISPVYLSRIVRQVCGRTVIDYVNQFLLMEASYLLRTSSLSVTQIADRLHFSDTASFSRFFSRLKGLSPKEYQKQPFHTHARKH